MKQTATPDATLNVALSRESDVVYRACMKFVDTKATWSALAHLHVFDDAVCATDSRSLVVARLNAPAPLAPGCYDYLGRGIFNRFDGVNALERRQFERLLECGDEEQGAVFDVKLLKRVFDAAALTACKFTQVEFVQHGPARAASLHWVSLAASFDVVVMPMRRI